MANEGFDVAGNSVRRDPARIRVFRAVDKWLKKVDLLLAGVGGLLILLMAVGISADVASRNFRGASFVGIIEYSEVGLVIATYFAVAHALRRGSHISVEFVVSRLNDRAAKRVEIVGVIVLVIAALVIFVGTSEIALKSVRAGEYRFGIAEVPVWPGRIVVAIGMLLFVLDALAQLVRLCSVEVESNGAEEGPATKETVF